MGNCTAYIERITGYDKDKQSDTKKMRKRIMKMKIK